MYFTNAMIHGCASAITEMIMGTNHCQIGIVIVPPGVPGGGVGGGVEASKMTKESKAKVTR